LIEDYKKDRAKRHPQIFNLHFSISAYPGSAAFTPEETEKDLSVQIHGVAIRHRGDEVANSPPFGLINIIDAVHLQLTQFFYKYQRDPDLTK
jgi:hypothetical protein